MSYDITVVGGEIFRVTEEQGDKLKLLKLNGKPSDNVELGNDVMELGRIKHIRKVSEPQVPDTRTKLLDDKRCRGERSIQREISKLIVKKYPTEWPTYIRDKAYKEKLRTWLHENREGEWCDYVAGTCVCGPRSDFYGENDRRVDSILSMFPGAVKVPISDISRGEKS